MLKNTSDIKSIRKRRLRGAMKTSSNKYVRRERGKNLLSAGYEGGKKKERLEHRDLT